jgi:hypothetical protein
MIASLFLCLTLALPAASPATFVSEALARWEFLGQKVVSHRAEQDVILVGVDEGEFSAIRLHVARSTVRFHQVIVVYANGRRDEIALRDRIPAGGTTRVIDLAGRDRFIRKVIFRYDTQSLRGRKALVRLAARR